MMENATLDTKNRSLTITATVMGEPKRLRNVFMAIVQQNRARTPVFPGALKNFPAGRDY